MAEVHVQQFKTPVRDREIENPGISGSLARTKGAGVFMDVINKREDAVDQQGRSGGFAKIPL